MTEKTYTRQKQSRKKKRKTVRGKKAVLLTNLFLLAAILIAGSLLLARWYTEKNRPVLSSLAAPSWIDQDFLDVNPYSRPGDKRKKINDIVVHYVANPGSSAKLNRDYFNNLAREKTTSASSHFIIGLEGEIIQCIPLDEIAYANYPRNEDTVSIECCHPDSTGEFTEATKESLYKLTAWLFEELNLTERHVIRHYDVIGKNCPKFYVEDEDAWKSLKNEMRKRRKES